MATASTVDQYITGFPPEVAERLQRIRDVILAEVPDPEERVRYGIAAVMLGGRYALHYAGWKKHIGLYPVPSFDEPLQSRVAPYRAEKDSVVFPHDRPVPYDLVGEIARAVVAQRAAAQSGSD